jgi:serine/threonine-protein kinase HipA
LSTRGSTRNRARDLRQLWTRAVFNILVSNTDDHLRNHGFILEPDGWRLAPAYDVNPNVEKRDHALAIDATDTTGDVGLAMATAKLYGLKAADASRILKDVEQAVRSWRIQARAPGLPRAEVDLMASAFKVNG